MPLTAITNPNLFAAGTSGTTVQLDANFATLFNQTNNLNTYSNYFADTGAVNAYVVAAVSGLTYTLAAGARVQVKIVNTNTAASTLNVFATGVKNILNLDGSALTTNQLIAAGIYDFIYDGTQYLLLNTGYATSTWTPDQGAGLTMVGAFTSSGGYTKIGNHVLIWGWVAGATSVALAAVNDICTTAVPFTPKTGFEFMGGAVNNASTVTSQIFALGGGTRLIGVQAIAATPKIFFSVNFTI